MLEGYLLQKEKKKNEHYPYYVDQLPEYSKLFSFIHSVHVPRTESNLIPSRLQNNFDIQRGKFVCLFSEACAELSRTSRILLTTKTSKQKHNEEKIEILL